MDDIVSMESPDIRYSDCQTKSIHNDRVSFKIPAEQRKDADGWITGVHPSETVYGYIFSINPPKTAFVPSETTFQTVVLNEGNVKVKYRVSYSLKEMNMDIKLQDYYIPDVVKITFLGRVIYYNGTPLQMVSDERCDICAI